MDFRVPAICGNDSRSSNFSFFPKLAPPPHCSGVFFLPRAAIDLLRSLEIIADDGPRFARRIVIEWGSAPEGCRLTLRQAG
jgi:hypothetical protein